MAAESESKQIEQRPEATRKPVSRARSRVPDHEIAEVRDVDFPAAMRGYDRAAVDAYVSRVNRLLAELQITAAPESAIRHALDEVADETRSLLERAHETAAEITQRSRAQADDRLQRAESEAEQVRTSADAYALEIRETAEKRVRALDGDAERAWQERDALIDEVRGLAAQLEQVAARATERYPGPPHLDRPAPEAPPAAAEPATAPLDDKGNGGHPLPANGG